MKLRIVASVLFTAVFLLLISCGTSADNHRSPWERPESPWRFQALLNEEPIDVEADTAWIHPSNGISFMVYLSSLPDWDRRYQSHFGIRPAIRTIPLDTLLAINDSDRLDEFEHLYSHTTLHEIAGDVIMARYRLNPEDTMNYIRFTRLEEDKESARYRAIIAGEYQAVYYLDPPGWDNRQLTNTVRITQGRFETVLLDWDDYDYWKEQH